MGQKAKTRLLSRFVFQALRIYRDPLPARAWYEMEWNGNFGVEYGRCQRGASRCSKLTQGAALKRNGSSLA